MSPKIKWKFYIIYYKPPNSLAIIYLCWINLDLLDQWYSLMGKKMISMERLT